MDNKFFYLYLIGAIVALVFCIYRLIVIKQADFRIAIDAIAFVKFVCEDTNNGVGVKLE